MTVGHFQLVKGNDKTRLPVFTIPTDIKLDGRVAQRVKMLPLPLSISGLALCTLVFSGYVTGITVFYRPLAGGPASHPITASVLFLISISMALYLSRVKSLRSLSGFALLIAFSLLVLNVAELLLGNDWAKMITPFYSIVSAENAAGLTNQMGVNTSLMSMALIVAQLLIKCNLKSVSQAMSFIAIAIPTVSFTGYAYGLSDFYGQMSLASSTIGLTLGIASISMTAEVKPLKAILNPYASGRVARALTLSAYFIPLVAGFVFVRYFAFTDTYAFGVYVVLISWVFILMVGASAIFQENIESEQQEAVYQLALAARTDSLTGLYNRKHFFDFATYELKSLGRQKEKSLILLMLDIDYFKRINDTAGHCVGDQVLRGVADILAQSVRSTDIVARVGGEEFALLLTDTSFRGAMRVAENIQHRVGVAKIEGWTEENGPVTISIGIAQGVHGMSVEDVLREADINLYTAKNSGRNKIIATQAQEH